VGVHFVRRALTARDVPPLPSRNFEVVPKKGLLVTTPAQTLLDLAAASWPIDRMTHDMAASGLASLDALRTFARNRRGEPGARALAKALDLPHTRSEWERRFLRWVTRLDQRDRPPHRRLPLARPQPRHRTRHRTDPRQRLEERDDAERDTWLPTKGKEVWRVDEETWDPPGLERRLRHRLQP